MTEVKIKNRGFPSSRFWRCATGAAKPSSKFTTGFTLIETLLAVLLLTSAIAGPLTIASKGFTATMVAKDQFTAFYLAQDAMEQVRFLRDSACLAAAGGPGGCPASAWLPASTLGLCSSPDGASKACYIDSVQSTVTSCTGGVCSAPLNYDPAKHFFSYTTGVPSAQRFIRTVTIKNDPGGVSTPVDEATVTVTVSWSDRVGVTRVPVTVRENIFRWQ